MKMVAISIRLDERDKEALDKMCAEMGMSVATFFTIYAKRALRERRIPFEVNAPKESFYSAANLRALEESGQQLREGKTITKTIDELEALADA
ncbi:MAG: type II toxin-antitoxin system RelB/DinJ family antitoxin [Clostridia bacterium]|nr:type II toxin-antitoxin system RelB/DinJ family antitoxin [Clostridia bacterium]